MGVGGASPQRLLVLLVPNLNGGGAQRTMVDLANGFAAAGYAVRLIVAVGGGPLQAEVAPAVQLEILPGRRALSALWAYRQRLRQLNALDQPVAVMSSLNYHNIVVSWAARLAKLRHCLVMREETTLQHNTKVGGGLRRFLFLRLLQAAYRRADHVIVNSHTSGRQLRLLMPFLQDCERLQVLPNPVDLSRFERQPCADVAAEIKTILAAGSLLEHKGFDTLLDAFARLHRQRSDTRLVICGEGPERAALEWQAHRLGVQSAVSLPGFVGDLPQRLLRADLFVLSSRFEGFGNVLIEAMAAGCPVVSTRCPGGPEDILEQGRWGSLVQVGDAEALAEAMLATLDKPPAVEGLQGRAAHFALPHVVETYARLLY